eukprot:GEMP01083421.1.p1 GENE.GEMP01083421.1~~GEMP01083421.1.p1  ORF type:complete len:145 (+),score=27.40 GEMP01083421.1:171-605(+)
MMFFAVVFFAGVAGALGNSTADEASIVTSASKRRRMKKSKWRGKSGGSGDDDIVEGVFNLLDKPAYCKEGALGYATGPCTCGFLGSVCGKLENCDMKQKKCESVWSIGLISIVVGSALLIIGCCAGCLVFLTRPPKQKKGNSWR